MPARVLVVEDDLPTTELLTAKLRAEYFDVGTARAGEEALDLIEADSPDIVLLDVMLPGMDGFDVCRRIKSESSSAHLPVVMITGLDQPSDRVRGLEAGADDFLTKPVNDVALFARARSLVRLKLMMDELTLREQTVAQLGVLDQAIDLVADSGNGARVLVVDDSRADGALVAKSLAPFGDVKVEPDGDKAVALGGESVFDLIIVSLLHRGADGLRLCSRLRVADRARQASLVALVDGDDTEALVRALEIGVNDYVTKPIDRNELVVRARAQIRRKRYQDRLRANYHHSMVMAVTDNLTGLHNRNYLETHLDNLVRRVRGEGKPVAVLFLDIAFFKVINDTHGHLVGDKVLAEFGQRIARNVRGLDLASRYGGEEFVVTMPDTDLEVAKSVAERLRSQIADEPFVVAPGGAAISVTVSIGVAATEGAQEEGKELLGRADRALIDAKRSGRNRIATAAAPA